MSENILSILVVDDDMLARTTAAQCVKRGGHTAAMADGGAAAMEMLQSDEYDLVLLDLMMPDVDGFEVLRHIRETPKLSEIPVIVVSGSGGAESKAKCLEMGASGYLSKPLDPALLNEQISGCMDKTSQT